MQIPFGQLVAGPRFHLFGPTVEYANRMESTGLPGKVQISHLDGTRWCTPDMILLCDCSNGKVLENLPWSGLCFFFTQQVAAQILNVVGGTRNGSGIDQDYALKWKSKKKALQDPFLLNTNFNLRIGKQIQNMQRSTRISCHAFMCGSCKFFQHTKAHGRNFSRGFATKQWLDIGGHDYIFEDRSAAGPNKTSKNCISLLEKKNIPKQPSENLIKKIH